MIYGLHELQRSWLYPFAAINQAGAQLFSQPWSPLAYAPVSRHIAAACELAHRLGKDYRKPEWGLETTRSRGRTVRVTPRVVLRQPFCNLLHFERDLPAGSPPDPVVLLLAPLSGHHATLLRDTVRSLLPAHDVYVTDWVDARMVPLSAGSFHLADYVASVQAFMRLLGPGAHLIAVCQPTVPALAAVSLLAEEGDPCTPTSMVLMGGPIDPQVSPTQVNRLATTHSYSWFENNVIDRVPARFPGAGRRVYPGFLQHAGFVAMNPDVHWRSHHDFYMDLVRGDQEDAESHRRFYDEYNAVLDLPAEFYLDTIRIIFQEHRLPLGTWEIGDRKVDPAAISRTALFTIEGELDDISGQGQTHAAQTLCSKLSSDRREQYTAAHCGHYGIFSGRRWRQTIYPRIEAFIRSHHR